MKPASLARWSLCFVAAIGIHAGAAAALLARWSDDADEVANAPVIMLDLAPVAVAPQTTPTDMPPDSVARPMQTGVDKAPDKPEDVVEKAEPLPEPEKPIEEAKAVSAPEKPVETKPEPQAELAILPSPKPVQKTEDKPDEKKKKEVKKKKPQPRRAVQASAPSAADQRAERAAAPAAGANRDSNALPNWKSRLFAQIERNKRYPAEAQSRGDRGVVKLAFSIDRQGGVHNARVVGSSGSSILDRETLAMIERAAPLPPPPDDVPGGRIAIVVPISYNIN